MPGRGDWRERIAGEPDVEVTERTVAGERVQELRDATPSHGERELRRREKLHGHAWRERRPVATVAAESFGAQAAFHDPFRRQPPEVGDPNRARHRLLREI